MLVAMAIDTGRRTCWPQVCLSPTKCMQKFHARSISESSSVNPQYLRREFTPGRPLGPLGE